MDMRKVKRVYSGQASIDGAGVHLTRVLGHRDVEELDPFLLLDYFDSKDPEDYKKGFPWHPHRGIETITYLLSGQLEHGDSLGNKGVIEPMGCQWMTAGGGILHQEMPLPSEHLHGCQLWLNLPREDKMTEPTYRDITEADLAVHEEDGQVVRVLCGTYKGKTGPVSGTFVDPVYLDIGLAPAGVFEHQLPAEDTVFLLLLSGEITFEGGDTYTAEKVRGILLDRGEKVRFSTPSGLRCLLMAARPLKEPIAWGGPIVMNTREELQRAFDDLDRGTFIR
jgi:redox-sensitive bicupin YhaK (pirin superfamily)